MRPHSWRALELHLSTTSQSRWDDAPQLAAERRAFRQALRGWERSVADAQPQPSVSRFFIAIEKRPETPLDITTEPVIGSPAALLCAYFCCVLRILSRQLRSASILVGRYSLR